MSICNLKYSVLISYILFSGFIIGQSRSVIIDELILKEGVYLHNEEKFSGIVFYKAKTGQFIAEVPFENGEMHGKRICYNLRGKVLAKEKVDLSPKFVPCSF